MSTFLTWTIVTGAATGAAAYDVQVLHAGLEQDEQGRFPKQLPSRSSRLGRGLLQLLPHAVVQEPQAGALQWLKKWLNQLGCCGGTACCWHDEQPVF